MSSRRWIRPRGRAILPCRKPPACRQASPSWTTCRTAAALERLRQSEAITEAIRPVRLEFPILSLNPGLRHRCVAPGVWPPGATDAVRVQGTHLIPLSPGASTVITELQFGGAPEAAPPPPSVHGRAGTTSVPRASARPDARTAGPAPAPPGSSASDVARSPRAAGQPSRHGITARPAASVAE